MSDWPKVRLADVAEIRFSNVDKVTHPGELPVRLCNYMDVYGTGGYVTSDRPFMEATASRAEIERFRIESGDVIVTKDSETPDDIGVPAVVLDDVPNLICGYHLALIRPKRNTIDPVYLAKQLASTATISYFSKLANGSTRYGLSSYSIASTPIPLASLPQQRRIAEILSTVDEQIEQTESLIGKLRQIKAGLMRDLFTRGVTPAGHLRPPRDQAPDLYKQSPLGWIPKEWEVRAVKEVCDTTSGGTPSRAVPAFWNGTIPWVRTGEIRYNVIEETEEYITELGVAHSAARMLPKGTVVMALFGQGPTRGRVAILGLDSTVNQACLAFLAATAINGTFLYYLFSHAYDELRGLSNDGAQQNLNASLVREFPIRLPARAEQDSIVQPLASLDTRIDSCGRDLAKLHHLKHGLMHDLLTGEVPVKVPADG